MPKHKDSLDHSPILSSFTNRYYYKLSKIQYFNRCKPKNNDIVIYKDKYLCFTNTEKTTLNIDFTAIVDDPISDKSLTIATVRNRHLKKITIFSRDQQDRELTNEEFINELKLLDKESIKKLDIYDENKVNRISFEKLWFK